jgi:hypothetical protein
MGFSRLRITRTLAVAAALSALGVACAKKAAELASSADAESPQQRTITQEDAAKLAMQAHVSCSPESDCPEPVGLVAAVFRAPGVSYCTGFLVDSDLALTSSHCVPEELRADGASCVGRIRMVFPTTDSLAESDAGCSTVVHVSGTSPKGADPARDFNYAFLRLDRKVLRAHFPLSADGLADGAPLLLSRVKMESASLPIGEIETERCRAVQNSAVLPSFSDARSPVAAVAECRVDASGLGAPLVGAQDGAVHAMADFGFDGRDRMTAQYKSELGDDQVTDFLFATNLACVSNPLAPPAALSPVCKASAPASSSALPSFDSLKTPALLAGARSQLGTLLSAWNADNSSRIRWKAQGPDAELAGQAFPVPDCWLNPPAWLNTYRKPWVEGGGFKASAAMAVSLPAWETRFSMSGDLQAAAEVIALPETAFTVTFDPAQISRTGRSAVALTTSSGRTLFNDTIADCK